MGGPAVIIRLIVNLSGAIPDFEPSFSFTTIFPVVTVVVNAVSFSQPITRGGRLGIPKPTSSIAAAPDQLAGAHMIIFQGVFVILSLPVAGFQVDMLVQPGQSDRFLNLIPLLTATVCNDNFESGELAADIIQHRKGVVHGEAVIFVEKAGNIIVGTQFSDGTPLLIALHSGGTLAYDTHAARCKLSHAAEHIWLLAETLVQFLQRIL